MLKEEIINKHRRLLISAIVIISLFALFASVYAVVFVRNNLQSSARKGSYPGEVKNMLLRGGEKANIICRGQNLTTQQVGKTIVQAQCEGKEMSPSEAPRPSRIITTQPRISPSPRISPRPTTTATTIPIPGAGYSGEIKITVDSYQSFKNEVNGLGSFLVYGWLSHGNLENFDSQVAKIAATLNDPNVSRRALLFSSVSDLEAKINEIPDYIDVIFYTTEPSYTPEYNDIFLENTNNCIVKAVNLAHSRGFPVHWGPLPGSLDFHSGIAASDKVLKLLADAGLDGVVMQYQSRIGTVCPDSLIWGPLTGKDTVEESVTKLNQFFPENFAVCIQVMPSGCSQGDSLGCGVDHYCRDFAKKLQDSRFMDYLAIWVPDVALIKAIRGQ